MGYWLFLCGLGQRLVSFRRIKGLSETQVKEIIPEVGTRIEFMDCLSKLKVLSPLLPFVS